MNLNAFSISNDQKHFPNSEQFILTEPYIKFSISLEKNPQ